MKKLFLFIFLTACVQSPLIEQSPVEEPPVEEPPSEVSLVYPIENFETGITLKSFGTYITPENSPVQPERFSGYHTGVDIEAGDLTGEVPVFSIADGKVVLARTVSGYGGVVVAQYWFDGAPVLALYGHLDMGSVTVSVGDALLLGQGLGVLGEGYTNETDGERKHLHFALIPGETVQLAGYVQSESALSAWLDPVSFFAQFTIQSTPNLSVREP
ncbi:MAG: M23 family metallopeptidase [Candidatus Gracilibacteria bacterium]|jgi:murein DD-endopeptidase MepM/ murein hydrolase activator NlpD